LSDAQFVKVRYKLTEKVAQAGGMTAGMAGERAGRELKAQREEAQRSLGAMLGTLEVMNRERTAQPTEVYDAATQMVDIAGLFDMKMFCDAAYSLSELTDRLRNHGRQDWPSIGVHINALRLIWTKDEDASEEVKAMVDGLWALTDRALEKPPAA